MQLPAAGEPAVAEAEQGDVEGTLECPFCRFGDRRRRTAAARASKSAAEKSMR